MNIRSITSLPRIFVMLTLLAATIASAKAYDLEFHFNQNTGTQSITGLAVDPYTAIWAGPDAPATYMALNWTWGGYALDMSVDTTVAKGRYLVGALTGGGTYDCYIYVTIQ